MDLSVLTILQTHVQQTVGNVSVLKYFFNHFFSQQTHCSTHTVYVLAPQDGTLCRNM